MESKNINDKQAEHPDPAASADASKQDEAQEAYSISVAVYHKMGVNSAYEIDDCLTTELEMLPKKRKALRLGRKVTVVPSLQVDLDITK
jgi:hypothetical protein